MCVLHKKTQKSVRAYFLSDMVIVTEKKEQVERLYSLVKLNEHSFCKTPDLSNFKYKHPHFILVTYSR